MEDWRNKLKSNGNRTYDVRAELIPRSQQSNFRSKFVPPDKGNNQVVRMAQPLYSPITKPSVSGGTPVLQNSRILSQSQTSAFERYSKSPPNNSPSGIDSTNYVRIGKIDIGKKLGKKTKAVGFAPDDQIVGDNGGCEYFIECENDQMTNGHINGRQPTPPLSPDFDPQTVANTIFNGDLKNFDSLLDAEVGRLIIGEILHIETTGSLKWKPEVSRIPIKHSHSESQVPKPMGNSLAPKPPPRTSRLSDKPTSGAATDNSSSTVIDSYVSTVKVSDIDTSVQQQEQLKSSNDRLPVIHVCDSFSDSNLSSLESSPDTVKELSPAVNDSLSNLLPINESNNEASVPMYTGKKTGKVNRELDSKLLELAKDLESLKTSPTSIGTSRSWMTAGNSTMSAGGLNSTDVRRSTSSTQLATEEMNNFPSLNNSHQMGNSRTLSDEMLSDKRAKVRLSGKFEQQQDNNNANISNAGRFSSIRRFLRIEKSSSDSRFASLSKKWSASFGRKLDINNTSGRPQIFHNVNGPCEATCELSHSDVKVTELLELSVSSPNSSKPNSQPQSPKAPREETVGKWP